MKKIAAFLLMLILATEMLLSGAMAETLPSRSEIEAALALTGYGENNALWHDGMKAGECMTARQLTAYLDGVIDVQIHTLENYYEDLENELDRLKKEDLTGYTNLTTGQYGGMEETLHTRFRRVESIRLQMEYWQSRLKIASAQIQDNAGLLDGEEPASEYETRLRSYRIREATAELRTIRKTMAEEADDLKNELVQLVGEMNRSNSAGNGSVEGSTMAVWAGEVLHYRNSVLADRKVPLASLFPQKNTLLSQLSSVSSDGTEAGQDVTLCILSDKEFGIHVQDEGNNNLEGASVTIVDQRVSENPHSFSGVTASGGMLVVPVTGFTVEDDSVHLSIVTEKQGYNSVTSDCAEIKKGQYITYAQKTENGMPYVSGVSLDWHDCLTDEYTLLYSPKNLHKFLLRVTVNNPSDESVIVCAVVAQAPAYHENKARQYYYTLSENGEPGKEVVPPHSVKTMVLEDVWRGMLKPGGLPFSLPVGDHTVTDTEPHVLSLILRMGATLPVPLSGENCPELKEGEYIRQDTALQVEAALIPEPVINMEMSGGFLSGALSSMSFKVPLGKLTEKLQGFLNSAELGFDFPFSSAIPRISATLDGTVHIMVGKDFGDWIHKDNGPLYKWSSSDSKQIQQTVSNEESLTTYQKRTKTRDETRDSILNKTDGGGLHVGNHLGNIGASVSGYLGIMFRVDYDAEHHFWTNKKASYCFGIAGLTIDLNVSYVYQNFVKIVVPIPYFLGVSFDAALSFTIGVGGVIKTYGEDLTQSFFMDNKEGKPQMDTALLDFVINSRFMLTGFVGVGIKGFASLSVNGYGYVNVLWEIDAKKVKHLKITAGGGFYLLLELLFAHAKVTIYDFPEYIIKEEFTQPTSLVSPFMSAAKADEPAGKSLPMKADDYPDLVPEAERILGPAEMVGRNMEAVDIGGTVFIFWIEAQRGSNGRNRVVWMNTETGASGSFEGILQDAAAGISRFAGIPDSVRETMNAEDLAWLEQQEAVSMQENTGLYDSDDLSFHVNQVPAFRKEYVLDQLKELYSLTVMCGKLKTTDGTVLEIDGDPRMYSLCFIPDGTGGLSCDIPMIMDGRAYGGAAVPIRSWRMLHSAALSGTQEELQELIMAPLNCSLAFRAVDNESSTFNTMISVTACVGHFVAAVTSRVPTFRFDSGVRLVRDTYGFYGSSSKAEGDMLQSSITQPGETAQEYYFVQEKDETQQLVLNAEHCGGVLVSEKSIPYYQVRTGLDADRLFYLTKETVGERELYHMHTAEIQHSFPDDPIEGTRHSFTDLDITLPGASFQISKVGGTCYLHWIESASSPEETGKTVYYLRAVVFDEASGFASDDFVLAQFTAPEDQVIRHLVLSENGYGYYILSENGDETEETPYFSMKGSVYRFAFRLVPAMDMQEISLTKDVIGQGENDIILVNLVNNGNTPISAFTISETAVKIDGNGLLQENEVESIHYDVVNPDLNRLHLAGDDPALDITGSSVAWQVPIVPDGTIQNYWEVTKTVRTFSADGSYSEKTETVELTAPEILPGQVTGYQMLIRTPSDWSGIMKLTFTMKDYTVPVNQLRSMALRSGRLRKEMLNGMNAPDDSQQLVYTLGEDGAMHLNGGNAAADGHPFFARRVHPPKKAELDHDLDNIVVGHRVYRMPDGTRMLSIVITNEAVDFTPIRLYGEVFLDDAETPYSLNLPYDPNATSHAATHTIDIPVAALANGTDARKAKVTVHGVGIYEEALTDNSFEVLLRDEADPLRIVVQPEDCTLQEGETAVMNVQAAGGAAPYGYQWQVAEGKGAEWKDLSGETGERLVLENVNMSRPGKLYRCRVRDRNQDTVFSREALLTVLKPIPATGDHFDGTLYLAVGMIILIGLLVTQRTGKRKKTSDRS